MDLLEDEKAQIKSEFILYGIESYIFDDQAASLELISESVSLAESNIAQRMTESLAGSSYHHIQRPNAGIVGMRALL